MKNIYKYLTYLFLALLILELGILIIRSKNWAEETKEYDRHLAINNANLLVLKKNMFNQMECQGIKFNNGLCVDLQQKKFLLQDLISQETLVFFIDEGYCTSCVKDIIDKIDNDEKLKVHTLIVCNNFPLRDMAQRYRSWETDITCISYKSPGENWLPA